MHLRQANINDLLHITSLFDAYRVFYRKQSDPEAASSFLTDRLEKKDSIIYLAFSENEEAVGFVQLYPSFSSTRMQRLWILNDLYVDPKFRGLGISKLLIDRSKQLCKETNACGLQLETEKSNAIGNKLYPVTGFELEENNFYFWTNTSS